MQITIVVSTDEGELTLKRTFAVTQDKRDTCIQAAATLLNVSMGVVEEIERKDATQVEKQICAACIHHNVGFWCTKAHSWYNERRFCLERETKK